MPGKNQTKPRPRLPLDRVLCGDALETLRALPDASVHLAITSPPYNLDKDYEEHDDAMVYHDYLAWLRRVWTETHRLLVPGGRLCINIGENKRPTIDIPTYSAFIQQLVELKMLYRGTIIWNKNTCFKHCAWGSWNSCSNPHIVPRHEYIIVFSKDRHKRDGDPANCDLTPEEFMACTRSVWEFGPVQKSRIGHPAPFPEELPRRLIKFYSYVGDTVLDMFAGSGTVGVVAKRLGRRYVLIDNSAQYCKLARRRIGQVKPEVKTDETAEDGAPSSASAGTKRRRRAGGRGRRAAEG